MSLYHDTGNCGGGLLFYVKDDIYNKTSTISEIFSVTSDLEQLWISIDGLDVRKKVFSLTYRPPGGNVEKCLETLRIDVEKVQQVTLILTIIIGTQCSTGS